MPTLYLFVGAPGAGKTTVAKIIAEATGGVHLWADVERHKRFPNPTHSAEESNELYDQLNNEADQLLAAGNDVIFDTNFNFRADRDKLRAIAAKHGAQTRVLWVCTPEDVAKDRATSEHNGLRNGYISQMSEERFDSITSKLEAPTDDEQPVKINGSNIDPAVVLQQLNLN